MSFDLSIMGRGDLCHDWRMSLLLADPVQDTGAAKPNAKTRFIGYELKSGVWWLRNGKNKLMRCKKWQSF